MHEFLNLRCDTPVAMAYRKKKKMETNASIELFNTQASKTKG